MQKYRVICPHCGVSLLVTEDLFGTSASCPGCHVDFRLPATPAAAAKALEQALGSGPATTSREAPPQPPPPPEFANSGIPSIFSAASPERSRKTAGSAIRIESRPGLRLVAALLKATAALQVVTGCLVLVIMLVVSLKNHPGTEAILVAIVAGLAMGFSAIPTLAFSELILVFISQDEMLRHIVNQLRSRD